MNSYQKYSNYEKREALATLGAGTSKLENKYNFSKSKKYANRNS